MRYYWLIFSLLFVACHEQNKNKISPAELVKSREIKKVSEAEILRGGSKIGDEILLAVNKIVQKRSERDSGACEPSGWHEMDSLSKAYNSKIQLVRSSSKNEQLEAQLLDAYQYNLENDLAPTPSIQKLDNKTVLYAYPIGKGTTLYKYCMDSARRKNAEMWSLKIPIKEVINGL